MPVAEFKVCQPAIIGAPYHACGVGPWLMRIRPEARIALPAEGALTIVASQGLIVIVGAGASFDCTPETPLGSRRLPLTAELFSRNYEDVLERHRRVSAVAPGIEDALRAGDAPVSLERHILEEYRRGGTEEARRVFAAILFYLEDLLSTLSEEANQGSGPVNYKRLSQEAVVSRAIDQVAFISLNYDTILDSWLEAHDTQDIRRIEDYVRADRRWLLLKPHGCVTWRRRAHGVFVSSNGVAQDDASSIVRAGSRLTPAGQLLRKSHTGRALDPWTLPGEVNHRGQVQALVPVIAAPLGPDEDEVLCPDEHIAAFHDRFQAIDAIDVLVIGYSGIDQAVLSMVAQHSLRFRRVRIVNGRSEPRPTRGHGLYAPARASAEAIARGLGIPVKEALDGLFDGGFSKFVRREGSGFSGLENFFRGFDSRAA